MLKAKLGNKFYLALTGQEQNFGRIYVYANKKVHAIHFGSIKREVPEYKDSGGVHGGYLTEYKRRKIILFGDEIPLPEPYGKNLYKVYTKWGHKNPSGYLIAKFFDMNDFR